MTNSNHSRIFLVNPKPVYNIGDKIKLHIETRTDSNRSKSIGGDFIRARLVSYRDNASVSSDGEVKDLLNGWYEASFTVRTPGPAFIEVVLVHTAEAVRIIEEMSNWKTEKRTYRARFESKGVKEERQCGSLPNMLQEVSNIFTLESYF